MTGYLANNCQHILRSAHFATPPARQLAMERTTKKLGESSSLRKQTVETWEIFIARMALNDFAAMRSKDFRRLLYELWPHETLDGISVAVLNYAVDAERKTYDRTIILAYLRYYPLRHPCISTLAKACEKVALRNDWSWKERGERWQLWKPNDGPAKLTEALLGAKEANNVLRDAGFDTLMDSRFLEVSLELACVDTLKKPVRDAEQAGLKLLELFALIPVAGRLDGLLAYALLKPWANASPSDSYRRKLIQLLVQRIGDPRINQAGWAAIRRDVMERVPQAMPDEAFGTLRRWLVQATVYEFFKIVGRTANDPVQWAAREKFWTEYLEAGLINDAWFAFGREARIKARPLAGEDTVGYGLIEGSGDASHSSLILSMGNVRIAEWSHNGACRFWMANDSKAPALYKSHYDDAILRAMVGGSNFERISHAGPWERKFAKQIYNITTIKHPKYGSGF